MTKKITEAEMQSHLCTKETKEECYTCKQYSEENAEQEDNELSRLEEDYKDCFNVLSNDIKALKDAIRWVEKDLIEIQEIGKKIRIIESRDEKVYAIRNTS